MTNSLALGAISQPAENELVALQNIQAELDRIQGASTEDDSNKTDLENVETHQDIKPIAVPSQKEPAKPVFTKVIIKKPTTPTTTQVLQLPQTSQNQPAIIGLPGMSPTKTITISKGGVLSPAKILLSSPQPKNILPKNKLPLSKTPTKITMFPVSGKSPQKIMSGAMTMLPKGAVLTTVAGSTDTKTLTLSPSNSAAKAGSLVLKAAQQSAQSRQSIVQLSKPLTTQMINSSGTLKHITIPIPGNTMQQIQVPGSKFNYIRLVSNPTTQSQGGKVAVSVANLNQTAGQMKLVNSATQHQVAAARLIAGQSSQPVTQRILLPATTSVVRTSSSTAASLAQIRPTGGGTVTGLPPGATLISTGGTNSTGYTLLTPAQYITNHNIQKQQTSRPVTQTTAQSNVILKESSIPIAVAEPASVSRHTNGSSSADASAPGQRPRKPCNCTKSQCLKLYCDCFANGEFCSNCNCTTCANNLEHEEERSRAIKSCLDRNPFAFHPKIGAGKSTGGSRRHNKGCNCKKSGCLKNYCECYEAKILCSNMCRCVGCKNYEESPLRKTLMNLADAAEVRVNQQAAVNSKFSSQMSDIKHQTTSGERLPYTFITPEVVEATCACLLAQAEDGERTRETNAVQEKMILEEFGRCLLQIVESANRTRAHSPMQQ